jgi:hypothetical protein
MKRMASQVVVGLVLAVLFLVAVPAPAAAHDNNCDAAVHLGPAKVHQGCETKYKGDETECFLSVNVGPVHEDVLCD